MIKSGPLNSVSGICTQYRSLMRRVLHYISLHARKLLLGFAPRSLPYQSSALLLSYRSVRSTSLLLSNPSRLRGRRHVDLEVSGIAPDNQACKARRQTTEYPQNRYGTIGSCTRDSTLPRSCDPTSP